MLNINHPCFIKFKAFIFFYTIVLNLIFSIRPVNAEVDFRVIPEFPYTDEEFYLIGKELKDTKGDIKFFINMGSKRDNPKPTNIDFTCDEKRYNYLSNLFKQSTVPVFILPGANVYWKCNNELQRNPLWEKYFFAFENNWNFDFLVKRQKGQKDNFSFFIENTLFIGVTLFQQKGRSNTVFKDILLNNISWIQQNLKQQGDKVKSLVIFAHEFSGLSVKDIDYMVCGGIQMNSWSEHKNYKYFSDQFVSLAKEFKRPILYIHGNEHCWTNDFPYKEAPNIERIVLDTVKNSAFLQIKVNDDNFLIDQRKNKRIDFYITEANRGDVWSQYFLIKEYLKLKDYENAKIWLEKVNKRNLLTNVMLGKILRKEKKYVRALELFQSAIKQKEVGIVFNQNIQNKIYPVAYQDKVDKFKREIIKRFIYEAFMYVGLAYHNGEGVAQNYQKSLEYFKKASEGGLGNAEYNIALMYYRGIGIKKDFKKAIIWFKKAASNGVAKAFNKLGVFYLKGEGVKQSYKEAAKWFKFARSDGPSLYNLGILYFKGLGVKQDLKIAVNYFKNASIVGNQEAKKLLENLFKIQIDKKLTAP
jgi:TPR repeat protein